MNSDLMKRRKFLLGNVMQNTNDVMVTMKMMVGIHPTELT